MLPRSYRLSGSKNIKKAKEKGKRYEGVHINFLVLERENEEDSRFSFVVSSKISKKAVDRNRIKRIMSNSVEKSKEDLKRGYDIVVLTKKSILDIENKVIEKEVNDLLIKSKLLK